MKKSLIKANIKGGKLCNEKIQQAVIDLRAELNLEHERNINNISCDNEYTSPMKKEKVSTINYSVYYESDEHTDTKKFQANRWMQVMSQSQTLTLSKELITYQSESYLSIQPSSELESLDKASPNVILTGARTLAATLSRTS